MLRRVASRAVPAGAKRALDRRRAERFLRQVAGPTEDFVRSYGLTVQDGPFAGMSYLPGLERRSGDLVAKLLGAYECELHAAVRELVAGGFETLVDVGCAEGYYAVGFARTMAGATVHAFDVDPLARERCEELGRINGVSGRLVLGAFCAPADLQRFSGHGRCALFCDCEGYEKTLLDPREAPVLVGWTILVELHDFIDSSISATLRERFASTHEIELISGAARDPARYPQLRALAGETQAALLSEYRPGPMQWALLRPRAAGP